MSEKSPDAYRTISEAGEEAGLPPHVLRFWESKFAQLKPVKRAGGRRMYRRQDVLLLKGLRRLLYDDGYTIKGAQKYLREHGVAAVASLADAETPAWCFVNMPMRPDSSSALRADAMAPGVDYKSDPNHVLISHHSRLSAGRCWQTQNQIPAPYSQDQPVHAQTRRHAPTHHAREDPWRA